MGGGKSKPLTLPLPGGKYSVGCADLMTQFSTDSDPGVFIRLFYPVEPCDVLKRVAEFPKWVPSVNYLSGYADHWWGIGPFGFLLNGLIGPVLVPCLWHAPLIGAQTAQSQKLPVIVFSHGLGAMRTTYSTFCSNLASHGYVVAAVEHRDGSACWTYYTVERRPGDAEYSTIEEIPLKYQEMDPEAKEFKFLRNRQLQKRAEECVASLHLLNEINKSNSQSKQINNVKIIMDNGFDWSQFSGRLDLAQSVIAGHSFGGATAILASSSCPQFRTGLILDPWMYPLEDEVLPRVSLPLCIINSSSFQSKEDIQRMNRLDSTAQNRTTILTIRDSVHQSQTDFTYLITGWMGKKLETRGNIDPLISSAINNRVSVAFLNRVLGLQSEETLQQLLYDYRVCVIEGSNIDSEENEDKVSG